MKTERILVVPDTHCPYHDHRAWKLMLKAARGFKPNAIVHMGDLCDFYKVSSHSKDPERSGFTQEIVACNKLLDDLDSLGAKKKIFIEGNHEDRLRRYHQDHSPELKNFVTVPNLLGLDRRKWEFHPYRTYAKIGRLYLTHDAGLGGRYSTAKSLDAFGHSVVVGHNHSMAYLVEGNATGEHMVGAQFGWLGDVSKIDYMHKIRAQTKWSLAFGYGYHRADGVVFLVPAPIINYSCCVEGKIYSV